MCGTNKGIVLALLFAASAGQALAEPSYLIYPNTPTVFRYDAGRYEIVRDDDPKFSQTYAIGGEMLWDRVENRIPVEVYRAPWITGFEPSSSGRNEFLTIGTDFEVIVDGFGPTPRTIGGLCVRFWPNQSFVNLTINGRLASGLTHALPPLEVTTPTGAGYFGNTSSFMLSWTGSREIRVIAFSDKNADRAFDGTPQFTIVARDETVSTTETTWGSIKAMYRQ